MIRLRLSLLLASLLALAPAVASAELFLNIGIGMSQGTFVDKTKAYSGMLGGFGAGWVGFEGDFSFTTNTPYHGAALRTAGGSLLVGPGYTTGAGGFRPYGSIGGGIVGAVLSVKQVLNPFDKLIQMDPMIMFGGGVIWKGPHIPSLGVRVDVRRIQNLTKPDVDGAVANYTRFTVNLHWTFKGGAK